MCNRLNTCHFDILNQIKNESVSIAGSSLSNVNLYKYSGILIDSGSNFDSMFYNIYNKANHFFLF